MSKLPEADDYNFHEVVEASELPVVVYFSATWCAPCQKLTPLLEGLADELVGQARIVKVDVDESVSVAFTHGILSVPTLALYHGGTLLNMDIRPAGRSSVLNLLEPALRESR